MCRIGLKPSSVEEDLAKKCERRWHNNVAQKSKCDPAVLLFCSLGSFLTQNLQVSIECSVCTFSWSLYLHLRGLELKTTMMTMNRLLLASVLVLSATLFIEAFVSPMRMAKMPVYRSTALSAKEEKEKGGIFGAVSNFFEELDAFVDDASMRRLGAGASFYGKRKSSFYGENDQMRKADRDKFDPTGKMYFTFSSVLCSTNMSLIVFM